jgi:hypothetical protein
MLLVLGGQRFLIARRIRVWHLQCPFGEHSPALSYIAIVMRLLSTYSA